MDKRTRTRGFDTIVGTNKRSAIRALRVERVPVWYSDSEDGQKMPAAQWILAFAGMTGKTGVFLSLKFR